jgi:ectoine hydroxylase-related dioxygenase (phytanoyl-CoA dioxygenase family)
MSSDIQRMANLLQVSSGFGRAMEQVDRARVVKAVYPALRASRLGPDLVANAVAASAEGYPFPTNLDLDQPVDGLTPISQAALVHRALAEGWEPAALTAAIADYAARRRT